MKPEGKHIDKSVMELLVREHSPIGTTYGSWFKAIMVYGSRLMVHEWLAR